MAVAAAALTPAVTPGSALGAVPAGLRDPLIAAFNEIAPAQPSGARALRV